MDQGDAFGLSALLIIVGAAMIVYVSYPNYIVPAVFLIGFVVLLMGVYMFLVHVRVSALPS